MVNVANHAPVFFNFSENSKIHCTEIEHEAGLTKTQKKGGGEYFPNIYGTHSHIFFLFFYTMGFK